jgi:hypothetical protein
MAAVAMASTMMVSVAFQEGAASVFSTSLLVRTVCWLGAEDSSRQG